MSSTAAARDDPGSVYAEARDASPAPYPFESGVDPMPDQPSDPTQPLAVTYIDGKRVDTFAANSQLLDGRWHHIGLSVSDPVPDGLIERTVRSVERAEHLRIIAGLNNANLHCECAAHRQQRAYRSYGFTD